MTKQCGNCGASHGYCAECGKDYEHGTHSNCIMLLCKRLNAPIDCVCGLVVSSDLKGMLDHHLKLVPWKD